MLNGTDGMLAGTFMVCAVSELHDLAVVVVVANMYRHNMSSSCKTFTVTVTITVRSQDFGVGGICVAGRLVYVPIGLRKSLPHTEIAKDGLAGRLSRGKMP